MKCRRFRRLALLSALVVLLAPPLCWLTIVLVAPTNWARLQVASALQQASGRTVQLGGLDVCLDGGISLANLRIGAPGSLKDPWLLARRIEIDVSPLELLRGRCQPSRVDVEDASLRLLRRADGSLELADLVSSSGSSQGSPARTSPAEPHHCGSCRLRARLHRCSVEVVDEPTQTRMTFEGVEGDAVVESDGAILVTLSGRWNQGPFQLTAHVDGSSGPMAFDGQFRCSDVVLDQGMTALRYLVPVLAGAPVELHGRLGSNVYLSGRGSTWEGLSRTLVGHGAMSLDPIALSGTPLLAEYARIANHPGQESVGSIHTDFVVKDGRIATDNLTMTVGRVPVNLSGWTAFNGALDYQVRVASLADRLPEKARKYMSSLDLDVGALTSLHLSGTVDRVAIRPNLEGPGRAAVEGMLAPEDRQKLKLLGRQLRDKLLR